MRNLAKAPRTLCWVSALGSAGLWIKRPERKKENPIKGTKESGVGDAALHLLVKNISAVR